MSETEQTAIERERARVRKLESMVYELRHGANIQGGIRVRKDDKDSSQARDRRKSSDL